MISLAGSELDLRFEFWHPCFHCDCFQVLIIIIIDFVFLQATKNPFYLHVGMDILQSIEKNAKVR